MEAKCAPEMKTVWVRGYERSDIFTHPKCVRIPQCGGCCGSNLLACEPIATEPIQIEVHVFEYNSDTEKLELTQTDKLQMEAHTKCKCGCRTKPEDCGPHHIYDESECQCICKNEAQSAECNEQRNRQWNNDKCECECYDAGYCERPYFWNSKTCECEFDAEVCTRIGRTRQRRKRRE